MVMLQKDADQIANSEDPDQTAPLYEQSDQGVHFLARPIFLKALDHYDTNKLAQMIIMG